MSAWRDARVLWGAPLAVVFVVLCTANSAGYRYGASDQAFYIPAVVRHLHPALFPRDAPLIDSQAKLTIVDDALAEVVRVSGATLPHVFVVLYVATLLLLGAAIYRVTTQLFVSRWAGLTALAAATLRHAVAKTGANTLEPYFHPRQLAFAIGLWAVSAFIGRRHALAVLLLVAALAIHPTTAVWFGVWLAAAAAWEYRQAWRTLAIGLVLAAVACAVVLWRGPLAGRLVTMDPAWLAVIADKDYLFPLQWPAGAWATNLLTVLILASAVLWLRRRGRLSTAAQALALGSAALFVLFLVWLPFNAAHLAIAVQVQLSRVFWLLDVWATICVAGVLAAASWRRAAMTAAILLTVASCARGLYTLTVQFPDRPLFAVGLTSPDWHAAAAWARANSAAGSGWLADPLHAARSGSSWRASAWRDVFLEQMKDTAIAMYDRSIAMRVADREAALRRHAWNSADGAQALAREYGLDYLIVDTPLPLPLAAREGSLYIYRLR